MLDSTSYNGKQYKVRALPPVMSNMLVSIIHTKWVVNCCTLSHEFYRSSSICWNVTYGQKPKVIKIKRQWNRVLYKLLRNTGIKGHKWTENKRNAKKIYVNCSLLYLNQFRSHQNTKNDTQEYNGNLALLYSSGLHSYQEHPILWQDWQNPFTHDIFSLCPVLPTPPINFSSTNSLRSCQGSPALN